MSNFYKFLIATVLVAGQVYAEQSIIIKDCEGNTQLVEVTHTNSVNVKVDVTADFNNQVAVIKNKSSQELKKTITGKEVIFENISAGEWSLCSEPQKVSFSKISVQEAGVIAASNNTTLGIAGASAAGALAIALGGSGNNSNSGSADTIGSVNNNIASNSVSKDTSIGKPAPARKNNVSSKADNTCFIADDTDVTPISVYK